MITGSKLPSAVGGTVWTNGPLARVTASGVPGSSVVNLISKELPSTLREAVFTRSHINLWDSPIQLSSKKYINVVGLEWLKSANSVADICLIHLEVNKTDTDLGAVTDYMEAVTRTWRKESMQFLDEIFPGQNLIDSASTQGLALIGFQNYKQGTAAETKGHILTYGTSENEPKLIHAYGAHVIAILALQQFSLDYLNSIWPADFTKRRHLMKFSQEFIELRHKYNWSSLFINSDARRIYKNFRGSLNIDKKYADFGNEITEALTLTQNKSSLRLTRMASIVAVSALIPVWFPSFVVSGANALLGMGATLALLALAWSKK